MVINCITRTNTAHWKEDTASVVRYNMILGVMNPSPNAKSLHVPRRNLLIHGINHIKDLINDLQRMQLVIGNLMMHHN